MQARLSGMVLVLMLIVGSASNPSLATDDAPPSLTAWQRAEEGHLTIAWTETARVRQKQDGDRLILRFARPLGETSTSVFRNLSNFIDPDRTAINGKDLSMALKPGVVSKVSLRERRIVAVDFFRDPARRPSSRITASAVDSGVRLTLDWPGPTQIDSDQRADELRLKIHPAWDIASDQLEDLQQTLTPWLRGLRSEKGQNGTTLTLLLEPQIAPSITPEGATRTTIDLVRDASTSPALPAEPERTVFIPRKKPPASTVAGAWEDGKEPPIPRLRPLPPFDSADVNVAGNKTSPPADTSSGPPEAIVIEWDKPVAAAAFVRAGHLWVVFDEPDAGLLSTLPKPSHPFGPVSIVPANGGTALLFPLSKELSFDVSRTTEGHWRIDPLTASSTVRPTPANVQGVTASRTLRVHPVAGTRIVRVVDPVVGDRLEVLPVREAGSEQPSNRRFVDLELLPTLQGFAWRPLNDRLVAAINEDSLEFSSPEGLSLSTAVAGSSSPSDTAIVEAMARKTPSGEASSAEPLERPAVRKASANPEPTPDAPVLSSYFSLAGAGVERPLVNEYRRIRRQAISRAAPAMRDRARLDLARLLVSERLATEARTVLDAVSDDTGNDIALQKQALRGVAAFLIGHIAEASALLLDPGLNDDQEIDVWRAALNSVKDDWQTAAERWQTAGDILDNYPPRLKLDLGLMALEAAIETDDDKMMRKGIRRLSTLPLNPYDQARVDAMTALKAERTGDLERARALLTDLTESAHPTIKTVADFKLAALDLRTNADDQGLLAAFDRRLPSWRGHPEEAAMLDGLARRLREVNALRKALIVWGRLVQLYPEMADTESLKRARQDTFMQALANAPMPASDLLEVYSTYLDFIDLLPGDPEVRDVYRHLARHLTDLDLLDQAIDVLQALLTSTNDDGERAALAADIAVLMLELDRAAPALAMLDTTEGRRTAQSSSLSEQRQLVRAQALARLGRTGDALRTLRDLRSQPARRLRARIFWDQRSWSQLADAVESYFAAADGTSQLTENEQELVLWLSLARQRAGPASQLGALRERFGAAMRGGPYAEAFDVATQNAIRTSDIKTLLTATEGQLSELRGFREAVSVIP